MLHKGFSNGSTYADLDNDGDLDVVTNNIDDEVTLFENHASELNNSITFTFNGADNNKHGVGVKVTLFSEKGQQYQEMTLMTTI